MTPLLGSVLGLLIAGVPTAALAPWVGRAAYRYDDEWDEPARRPRWLVPVAALAGALVGAAWASRPALMVLYAVCCSGLAVLSAIDLDVHRLPDRFTKPALVLVPVALAVVALVEGAGVGTWARSLAVGLGVGVVFFVLALVGGGSGLGMGDVKLSPSIGALMGYLSPAIAAGWVVLTFVLGGLAALSLLLAGRGRKSQFAFGPSMALAAVLVWGMPLILKAWL